VIFPPDSFGHFLAYDGDFGAFLDGRQSPCHGHLARERGIVRHEPDSLHDFLAGDQLQVFGLESNHLILSILRISHFFRIAFFVEKFTEIPIIVTTALTDPRLRERAVPDRLSY